jgi:hypothetical protein
VTPIGVTVDACQAASVIPALIVKIRCCGEDTAFVRLDVDQGWLGTSRSEIELMQ